jgi:predicted ATPase
VESAARLSRFAGNLANAFQTLRNAGTEKWQRVVARAALGLGDDVRDIVLQPANRGSHELQVRFGRLPHKPMPAEALSDGQLSYLCFVALTELDEGRSLLRARTAFASGDLGSRGLCAGSA